MIVETIGTVPDKGVVYLGFEPTGPLHEGHMVPIRVLNDFAEKGYKCYALIADICSDLNGKDYYEKFFDELKAVLHPDIEVLYQSVDLYPKAINLFNEIKPLLKKASLKRTLRSITAAGREDKEEGTKMSWLVYSLLQVLDMETLKVDVAIGGTDQRHVHMLARDLLEKPPVMIHTKLLLGADGKKLSKTRVKA